jgi:hypothetical protein
VNDEQKLFLVGIRHTGSAGVGGRVRQSTHSDGFGTPPPHFYQVPSALVPVAVDIAIAVGLVVTDTDDHEFVAELHA